MSSLIEDISSVTKSSITLSIFILLLCSYGTDDMKGSLVDYVGVAYMGCSHIATNLGPHRAQTWWVFIYLFIV